MTEPPEVLHEIQSGALRVVDGRESERWITHDEETHARLIRIISHITRKATDKQREVIELHLFRGLTQEQTAAVLGVSARAVRYRLRNWLDSLGF